jgi:hypothetical protein
MTLKNFLRVQTLICFYLPYLAVLSKLAETNKLPFELNAKRVIFVDELVVATII